MSCPGPLKWRPRLFFYRCKVGWEMCFYQHTDHNPVIVLMRWGGKWHFEFYRDYFHQRKLNKNTESYRRPHMKEENYTSGPWKPFSFEGKIGVAHHGSRGDICMVSGLVSNRSVEEILANASLIAAAPAMLDALRAQAAADARSADKSGGYEAWQALEDKASDLRKAALSQASSVKNGDRT